MTMHSTIEDELRDRLDRATSDVQGGPDLRTSIAAGRRRRAVRRGGAVASGVAAVAVVAVGAAVTVGAWQRPATQLAPAAGASPSVNRIPGSTVDETMAQVVADHVARPGDTTGIFASDWTRSTPLPGSEVSRATEWQANYRVDGDETLSVLMSQRPMDAPVGPRVCDASTLVVDGGGTRLKTDDVAPDGEVKVIPGRSAQGATACVARQTAGGTLVVTHDGSRTTATLWRTADATVVTVTSALGRGAAVTDRRVSEAEMEAVATDPRLEFAHVADPPAWPASNGPGWPAGV